MFNMQRILIIDDDQQLVTMLAELLRLESFVVTTSARGEEGLRALQDEPPALVILDVMMPGIDGFETLRRLRSKSAVPVLMLTARGDAQDRISGLEHGADDYLAKPFNPRELLLRIRAILKRHDPQGSDRRLQWHNVTLHPDAMQATLNDNALALTTAECKILEALLRDAGHVVSREVLTRFALGRKLTPYDRALDTHISNLRHKFAAEKDAPRIRNVRGSGYLLVAPVAE